MANIDKYAFVRCAQCEADNKLVIDNEKSGHYQCGHCASYLMFYGEQKQKKSKAWIWGVLISIPIGYLGYQHIPNENNWTNKKIETFKKACEANAVQKMASWSSSRVKEHCECFTQNLIQYDYASILKSPNYYLSSVKKECIYAGY